MLKTFRDNFKRLKWILWAVIAVFIVFVFVDWGMGTTRVDTNAETAAEIGGYKISVAEFQREYRDTEQRYRQMYGGNLNADMLQALNLPSLVVGNMVDRHILRQEASKLGLAVTDDELQSRILNMKDSQGRPIFLRDGAFVGQETYRRVLASAQMTPAVFESQTRDEILIEKLNRFYTNSAFVSDQDVQDDYASRMVKAKISYVMLPAAPGAAPSISDAEAETYFKANSAEYTQPEKRKAKYLVVETAKLRANITVTDAEIAADYSANAAQYRTQEEVSARHILYKSDGTPQQDEAAKAKAEAALKKLRAGADFAELAKNESEDPGSKTLGGDLGSFGRGRMVKEFEEAAFGANPGDLTGPIKTPFGYHIIQVSAKTPERVQPVFEVAPAIRARLQEKKASDEARRQASALVERVKKLGKKPSDDELRRLTDAVVTFNETEFISRDSPATGVGSLTFNETLFGLGAGEVSTAPVTTNKGEAIVKLAEVKPAGIPTFAEVKPRVIADMARKKQEEAAVAALKAEMGPEASLESIAQKLNLKIETPDAFAKSGPIASLGNPKALVDAVFAGNPGEFKGPIFVQGHGAVAFKILEKNPLDEKAFATEKDSIRERLKTQKAMRLLQAMLNQRKEQEKVKINPDVISRFGGRA
ncbi:MAG: SurA N-terminal domain-containing protein [Thermoanaerobaculia bacterium]|nr:SurA N-terminal domain-containing protein [Thermoanaerobaculia bacterium]